MYKEPSLIIINVSRHENAIRKGLHYHSLPLNKLSYFITVK